jgi:hypothetical protein
MNRTVTSTTNELGEQCEIIIKQHDPLPAPANPGLPQDHLRTSPEATMINISFNAGEREGALKLTRSEASALYQALGRFIGSY